MSNAGSPEGSLNKNERREAAREKARVLRVEQKKKDRRTRWILQGSIIVASLAIIAVIALVITNSIKPVGPGPLNMASDGIQLSEGAVALKTPATKAGADPVPNERDPASEVIDIQMYVDYMCPFCGEFEATNSDYITSLLDNGGATVEIHPLAILDRLSQGTKYSTRAANAVACVANYSPNQFYDFHNLLFANQPEENSVGLTDEELIAFTEQANVESASSIADCITSTKFKAWVGTATARALNGPIPNAPDVEVKGTPTVLVNGIKYAGAVDDADAFKAFVVQAAGGTFNENSTPTPTPSPAP